MEATTGGVMRASGVQEEEIICNLIKRNLPLIRMVVCSYRNRPDYEDLLQEAMFGFAKGIRNFDPSRGAKLTSYAFICARNEVKVYLRNSAVRDRGVVVVSLTDAENSGVPANTCGNALLTPENFDERIYESAVVKKSISIMRDEMTKTQQKVLVGFLEGNSQSRIAQEINLSQPQVSRILKASISNLRQRLRDCGLLEIE